jgi:hypothetical protein
LPEVRINGKPVLLDPHSAFHINKELINKFGLVGRTYGLVYYVMVVVDTFPAWMDHKLDQAGDRHAKIGDEVWYLMDDPPQDGEYHNKYLNMKGAGEKVKSILRTKLEELKGRDSGPIPLFVPRLNVGNLKDQQVP